VVPNLTFCFLCVNKNHMSRSTSIDINYLSYACDSQGTCAWSLSAGSPDIVQVPAPAYNDDNAFLPPNPTNFASILKLADSAVITLHCFAVEQGRECSVDVNNKVNATIRGVFGNSTNNIGNQIFSVKGNSNVTIVGTLKGAGNRLNADILVDNWSDQDYNGSTVNIVNAIHETGRKLNVVYRIGSSKIIGDCNKLLWQSIQLTAYFFIKLIIRKVMGIKQGHKGPSFL
jgi:hypothetical protein